MFFFGHLGFGLKLATPWGKKLSKRLILLGAILPDLIDKPLYYGLSWATGKDGADLGIIAGTRSFGHSALTLIMMTATAAAFRARWLAAICVGVATHLVLDNLGDRFLMANQYSAKALLWPLMGWTFPTYSFGGLANHLLQFTAPYFLITEVVGAAILIWEYWKTKRRDEMARAFHGIRSRETSISGGQSPPPKDRG